MNLLVAVCVSEVLQDSGLLLLKYFNGFKQMTVIDLQFSLKVQQREKVKLEHCFILKS